MALTTYNELRDAVADYMARGDLSNQIVDCIDLFGREANRRLRVRDMETTDDLTPVDGDAELPEDYLSWRRVTWLGDSQRELEYAHPSYLASLYPSTVEGTPSHFTIQGGLIKIRPASTTDIRLDYFAKITPLSEGTNWLFEAHPDAYLAGALFEAHMLTKDFQTAALWRQRRDEILTDIETLSLKSIGPAAVRVMGSTP